VKITSAGDGTLGPFTFRNVRAIRAFPEPSSTCSGATQIYFSSVSAAAVFRFQDGSLLKVQLTQAGDCIDLAALEAHCTMTFQITGGTGRFKNASGSITLTETVVPVLADASNGAELVYSDSVVNGRDENGYPERTGRLCRLDLNAPGGSPQVLLSEYDTGEIPYLWTRYGSLLFYKDPSFGLSVMLDGVELFSIPAAGGQPRSFGISTLADGDWSSLSPKHDALAICVGDGRETYTNKRIAVLDLKSNAVRYLTDTKTA